MSFRTFSLDSSFVGIFETDNCPNITVTFWKCFLSSAISSSSHPFAPHPPKKVNVIRFVSTILIKLSNTKYHYGQTKKREYPWCYLWLLTVKHNHCTLSPVHYINISLMSIEINGKFYSKTNQKIENKNLWNIPKVKLRPLLTSRLVVIMRWSWW